MLISLHIIRYMRYFSAERSVPLLIYAFSFEILSNSFFAQMHILIHCTFDSFNCHLCYKLIIPQKNAFAFATQHKQN